MKQTLWLCITLLTVTPAGRAADCPGLAINTLDQGWYSADGFHAADNNNYFCGKGFGGTPLRNWFAFNIPVLTQAVASASLRLFTFAIDIPGVSEAYELREVSTPTATLRAGGGALTNIYADLADGAVYGIRTFSHDERDQYVTIPLNASFIARLVAVSGGTMAVGGHLTTLDTQTIYPEFLFGGSSMGADTNAAVQLNVTYSNTSPLTIVQQPASLALAAGDTATFNVGVCGGGASAYQWQRSGTNLPGAIEPFLQLRSVLPADSGSYRVLVNQSMTTVTSMVATLSVSDGVAPSGTIYINSGVSPTLAGSSVSFCSSISGLPSPAYQWQFNETNLPGQNGPCLFLSDVQTNQSGSYRLVATNVVGGFTSAPITLLVTQAAPSGSIYLFGSPTTPAGSSVTLCSTIIGGPVPRLQWQFNGGDIINENASCLYLSNVGSNQSGSYRLIASNVAGVFTSAPIALTVQYFAPTGVLYFSSGQSPAPAGSFVQLCSVISGAPFPTFQWQFNEMNLPGQNASCLNLYNVSSNVAGRYRLLASNASGVFTSAPIALAVNYYSPSGSIYFAGTRSPAPAGSYVALCSSIAAAPPPTYQWQLNGTNLTDQTSSCLGLFDVSSNQAGAYQLVASNSSGVFTSAPVTLVVSYFAPTGAIYIASGGSPAPAASSVQLCSAISAAPPPTYQWQFNEMNLPGQNASCLFLSNLSSNNAGNYRLIASNSLGLFTSAPVALAVDYYAPFGSISPVGVLPAVLEGSTVSICSSIAGAPPPTYQWQFNGVNLPGQTYSCLNLYNAQTNQSGSYRLVASNLVGNFTSAVARVSITHARPSAAIYLASGHTPTTVGNSLTMCASVSGAPSPTLQWQLNGTNLVGQTNSCLYLPNLQTNQSGGYTVVASNIVGLTTSAVAMVSVIPPVPLLAYFATGIPPRPVGGYETLCAELSLPSPQVATWQWRFNGTNLIDATNQCYSRYPLQSEHAGDYSVVASIASGTYTSPPIALTVYYAPPTLANPVITLGSSQALVGEDIGFYASYSGSLSAIQWLFNDAILPGQTNASLSLLAVTTNQAGQYSFTASNVAGMTTSSVVTLDIRYQAPMFVSAPYDQVVVEGTTARFRAYALAGPPAEYFLELDGTNVAVPFTYEGCCGVSSGGFSLLDTTFADAGNYRVIASNFLGAVTSTVATLTVTAAGPLDRWTQRNPLPQSQSLFAIAHDTNQFVAVGDRGTILTSPDGSNWAVQNRRADLPLNGVAFGAGLFVVVGDGGTILSSADGTNWAYRYTAAGTILNAITYGADRFVAVGQAQGLSTLIITSADGVNWQRIPMNGFGAQQCIAYGNGRFIAAGSYSILRSTDGTNWILSQNISRQLESITYEAGLYVAVGDDGTTLVSTDGISWVSRPAVTTRRLLGVTYGNGKFVAAGARGNVLVSSDTVTWTPVASGTPDRLETIDFSNGLFVVAGENGTMITSTNGVNWTKQNFGVTRDLDGMDVAHGTLVVVGKGGTILTSTNGVTYTAQNAGVTNDLHGALWGGGLWVVVGEPGIILTSTNAIQWTRHDSGTTSSLKDGTYAGGQWIVVGTQGAVVRSTDAVNWTATYVNPEYDLNDVAFGNGVYLIAGDGRGNANGSVFRSLDGVAWNLVDFYPGKNMRGVTFANGFFLFPANDGSVFMSTNGLSFASSFPSGSNLRAATWAQGLWTVVGNDGAIITSPDLVTWTRHASRIFENLHQVVSLDGKLVVIGNRGTILQSDRFVTELGPLAFVPGTGFRIQVAGPVNQTYQIQASTNLANWATLLTFTNMAEHTTFTDPDALQYPWRFYRLVAP